MAKKLNIPLLDLKREYLFLKKHLARELKDVFLSQHWILGEKVSRFEKEAAGYLGSNFVIGVASGTDALLLSLRALALKLKNKEYFSREDEIITTPFTFVATAEAIVRAGATPVFVDIDPDTFNIDPGQIRKAVNKNTVGIMPVHIYGLACDMNVISEIARENNLFIVEDVAQAFGAGYKLQGAQRSEASLQGAAGYRKLGAIGDCGAFSTFPSKNLGGYGDGGFVATNDEKLAEFVRILRNHGQKKKYDADYIGYNSRLDSIQAAVLSVKLKYIDKFNSLRRKVAGQYKKGFKPIKELKVPFEPEGCFHVYHLYSLKVPASSRDKFLEFLNSQGIESRIYYPVPLNKMAAFKSAKVNNGLPNLNNVLSEVLTLPLNPFLNRREIDYILKQSRMFYR